MLPLNNCNDDIRINPFIFIVPDTYCSKVQEIQVMKEPDWSQCYYGINNRDMENILVTQLLLKLLVVLILTVELGMAAESILTASKKIWTGAFVFMMADWVKSCISSILIKYCLHVLDDHSFLYVREKSVFKQTTSQHLHFLVNHDHLATKHEFRD